MEWQKEVDNVCISRVKCCIKYQQMTVSCLLWADNTMRGGVGHGPCRQSIATQILRARVLWDGLVSHIDFRKPWNSDDDHYTWTIWEFEIDRLFGRLIFANNLFQIDKYELDSPGRLSFDILISANTSVTCLSAWCHCKAESGSCDESLWVRNTDSHLRLSGSG